MKTTLSIQLTISLALLLLKNSQGCFCYGSSSYSCSRKNGCYWTGRACGGTCSQGARQLKVRYRSHSNDIDDVNWDCVGDEAKIGYCKGPSTAKDDCAGRVSDPTSIVAKQTCEGFDYPKLCNWTGATVLDPSGDEVCFQFHHCRTMSQFPHFSFCF